MPVVTYGWKLSNNDSDVQSTNHFLWQTPSSPHNIKAHSIWRQESEHWCGFRGFRWWQSSRKCTQRWIRFKLNKFSLCELVQQNLKSWLETTHKEGCLKHQWTLLLHITEHMYQSTREPPTSVTNITKWMGQYWSVKIMKNIIAKVDKIIKLKT